MRSLFKAEAERRRINLGGTIMVTYMENELIGNNNESVGH